jgi:hypothetical protein
MQANMPSGEDTTAVETIDLESVIAAMRRDYSKLGARIRLLDHSVLCDCKGVTLRLHFPAFRQGKATVSELIDTIAFHLPAFCLSRSEIVEVDKLYGTIPVDEFKVKVSQLSESAKSLFKRASKATNRNGEAGELLLYLLTEWILAAPQLIAKMSLKTNTEMPVHGSDGVHVRFCAETSRLLLYWGESKLYGDVNQAITEAMASICEAFHPDKMKHEIELVQRNINLSGLDDISRQAILSYLDPFDEAYNERHDVITCLIGFDFEAFKTLSATDGNDAENKFTELAKAKLGEMAPKLAKAVKAAGLDGRPIEMFFFPVPSVQELRNLFQNKIGWKQ